MYNPASLVEQLNTSRVSLLNCAAIRLAAVAVSGREVDNFSLSAPMPATGAERQEVASVEAAYQFTGALGVLKSS